MTHSRGQAALELIMTYAWAILAAVVILGSLSYFTGFYARFFPDNCELQAPFGCTEYKASNDGVVLLAIRNGAGYDLTDVTVAVECNRDEAQQVSVSFPLVQSNDLLNGSFVEVTCPIEQASFRANLAITYTESGESVSHTSLGSMRYAIRD
jgi:hypothetical protein